MRRKSEEHGEQVQVFRAVDERIVPNAFVFAIETGGARIKSEAVRLRARGVRAGTPDICAIYQGTARFIEMKRERGGVVSDAQNYVHALIRAAGCEVVVCAGAAEAIAKLTEWGILRS
jgi:hypothetical protein